MEEIYEFVKEIHTYYLATVEGDQPRVRPFGTIDLFDGKLYIQTGLKKNCAKQMLANGKIEICGLGKGKWVRITATAVLDERIEAQEHMLDAFPNLRGQYTPGDGNTAVFYLKDATCYFSNEPERVIKF